MLFLLIYTNIHMLSDYFRNNMPWLIVFYFLQYYLFLFAVISLAEAIPLQKQDLEKYDKQIITKKDIFILIILVIVLSAFLCIRKFNNKNYTKFIEFGEWIVVDDNMSKIRNTATANLLPDGNVLIMGGTNMTTDTADIFDPNQMKIIKTIPLNDRISYGYTATTLKNGNVFVAGGTTCSAPGICKGVKSTKIFDSDNYTFRNTKPMEYEFEVKPQSILLSNGNILILHGLRNYTSQNKKEYDGKFLYQIYNPYKDEYYFTKNIPYATWGNNRFLTLEDGNILVFSGASYIYDIKNNEFSRTNPQRPEDFSFTVIDSNSYLNLAPAEKYTYGYLYNINENKEIFVKNHINKSYRPEQRLTTVALDNDKVLIIGTFVKNNSDKALHKSPITFSAYIYDKNQNLFYEIPAPPYSFTMPGIVKLKNGNILFAGGSSSEIGNKILIFKYKY